MRKFTKKQNMIRHVKHKSLKSYFNFKKYGNSNTDVIDFIKNIWYHNSEHDK